ncbi:MAG: hypothetical protein ACFFCW_25250 [Candidatus Hodarchaeota archaeon]
MDNEGLDSQGDRSHRKQLQASGRCRGQAAVRGEGLVLRKQLNVEPCLLRAVHEPLLGARAKRPVQDLPNGVPVQ